MYTLVLVEQPVSPDPERQISFVLCGKLWNFICNSWVESLKTEKSVLKARLNGGLYCLYKYWHINMI